MAPSRDSQTPSKRPRPLSPSPSPPPNVVSRNQFILTGGVTPAPLAPHIPRAKPTRRHQWTWSPFCNPARTDSLQLSHWQRNIAADGAAQHYPFARFNKTLRILTYTDTEYEQVIRQLAPPSPQPSSSMQPLSLDNAVPPNPKTSAQSSYHPPSPSNSHAHSNPIHCVPPQKPWTKPETDHLFELCQQFDLRFPVILDRWPSTFPPRRVDELKDRYYTVAKSLVEHRTQKNPNYLATLSLALQKHCQAITMNPFDYEYELVRKNQLEFQYRRSKTELRGEEEIVRQARRIESNRKRLLKERQRLAKLLTPMKDPIVGKVDFQPKTFPHRKVITGAYARSCMIYNPLSQSARISKRIEAGLMELGVGLRPTPTSIVVDNFDLLRMDVLAFIELQRTVLKKEEDTHLLRVKLAKLKGLPVPLPPPGVTLSHKKRRADDVEVGSLFGPVPTK